MKFIFLAIFTLMARTSQSIPVASLSEIQKQCDSSYEKLYKNSWIKKKGKKYKIDCPFGKKEVSDIDGPGDFLRCDQTQLKDVDCDHGLVRLTFAGSCETDQTEVDSFIDLINCRKLDINGFLISGEHHLIWNSDGKFVIYYNFHDEMDSVYDENIKIPANLEWRLFDCRNRGEETCKLMKQVSVKRPRGELKWLSSNKYQVKTNREMNECEILDNSVRCKESKLKNI